MVLLTAGRGLSELRTISTRLPCTRVVDAHCVRENSNNNKKKSCRPKALVDQPLGLGLGFYSYVYLRIVHSICQTVNHFSRTSGSLRRLLPSREGSGGGAGRNLSRLEQKKSSIVSFFMMSFLWSETLKRRFEVLKGFAICTYTRYTPFCDPGVAARAIVCQRVVVSIAKRGHAAVCQL